MLPDSATTGAPTVSDAVEPASGSARGLWLAAGAAVLIATVAAVTLWAQSLTASPEQFAEFAQKLETLSGPTGSFTPYNPTVDGNYGTAPQGSWSRTGTGTWSSAADPSWWVAVRGWQATVTVGQEPETCRAVLDWLATSGSQLGLTNPNQNENLSACLSVLAAIRSTPGSASDVWSGRGTQTADGQPRYRTGVEAFTGGRPDEVILRVAADATLAHG